MFITQEWIINGWRSLCIPERKAQTSASCWHQPSITAWCIYLCVGGRLAECWGAWSSWGHGTQSLVRSIKYGELAFWAGNWGAWALPHSPECHIESWLKSTHTSLLGMTAHSTTGVFDRPCLGPQGLLCEPSYITASSIDFLCRQKRNSSTCDFNLGKACFLLWPIRVCHNGSETGHLSPEGRDFRAVGGGQHPMFPVVPSGIMVNEERARSKEHGNGKGASCYICCQGKWMRALDWSDIFWEAEDYFQMKTVMWEHEEERNRSQLFWGQKCRDAHAVLRITSVFLAFKWELDLWKCWVVLYNYRLVLMYQQYLSLLLGLQTGFIWRPAVLCHGVCKLQPGSIGHNTLAEQHYLRWTRWVEVPAQQHHLPCFVCLLQLPVLRNDNLDL